MQDLSSIDNPQVEETDEALNVDLILTKKTRSSDMETDHTSTFKVYQHHSTTP